MKRVILIVLLTVIVLSIVMVVNSKNDRLDPYYIMTESCLVNGLCDDTFVYVSNVEIHTGFLVSNETVLNFLHLSDWIEISAPQMKGQYKLIVNLGDSYDIYIYDNYAYIYDGYASFGKNTGAYYIIPQAAVTDIETFISLHSGS